MKARLIALAGLLLLASCAKEKAIDPASQQGKQVTIRVSMPDPDTRVSFTPEEGKLALAWQDGDCIRVVSESGSSVFTISRIISDHEAEFTGPEVPGTSYEIICPGTYASFDEAHYDRFLGTQNGNGSADHLVYKAFMTDVDSYTDIALSSEWAEAHGGVFREGAAVKLQAKLPEGVTTLKQVALSVSGWRFTLPLENVDVSADDQVLTAYMMLTWDGIGLPDGTLVDIYATGTDNEVYAAQLPISGEKEIMGGKMNSFTGVKLALTDFAGGDGTRWNPYLIANARHLDNLHKSGLLDGEEELKYFELIEDIDASSISNWTPLNNAAPFAKGLNLDGAGHTISGLKSSGVAYASFAGVLYGSLSNVTFSGATINATSKAGVVAGFLGTTQNDYSRVATCTNVTVAESTVTSTAAAGGFAGHVRGKGAITSCKVINTTVNGTSHLGGFTAIADITGIDKYEVPAIFTFCEVDGVTLNQNQASASSNIYTGGFIGESYQAHSFINCQVKGTTITANKAAVQNVGGFVGYTGYAGANFNNCVVDEATTITASGNNTGGFVGYATVSDAYTTCSTSATVNAQASYVGGFAGYASGSAAFNDCAATGNVTGQRFTAGFVGVAENASFINCRYVTGTVTASTTNNKAMIGGFVGSCISGVNFNDCAVVEATVSAASAGRVGGFAGQLGNNSGGGNNVTTTQCRVSGTNVTGGINTGGFCGVQYETTDHCYVSGDRVTANGNNCGGFSGFVQNGDIRHCYTLADVVGGSYSPVGGFIGVAYTSNVSYCYAAGSISGSGANVASFVGQCAQQNGVATISNCIGWNATLPFCASNTVGASITDVYSGNEGTVSTQAIAQTWPTTVWDLTGDQPVLLSVPARIPAIFVGDSITWQWARTSGSYSKTNYPLLIPFDSSYMTDDGNNVTVKFHPGFFAGNGYIDKGISGQNTTQMLARFQKDVVDLEPKVVVIMGGTNDLAQGVSKEEIVSNIGQMADMAIGAGIKVVLCTVTPNNDKYSRLDPKNKGPHIIELNGMLKEHADACGYSWCDYWSSLVADDGLSMKEEYRLYDNLHPGPVAYTVMEGIIKPIIDSLL